MPFHFLEKKNYFNFIRILVRNIYRSMKTSMPAVSVSYCSFPSVYISYIFTSCAGAAFVQHHSSQPYNEAVLISKTTDPLTLLYSVKKPEMSSNIDYLNTKFCTVNCCVPNLNSFYITFSMFKLSGSMVRSQFSKPGVSNLWPRGQIHKILSGPQQLKIFFLQPCTPTVNTCSFVCCTPFHIARLVSPFAVRKYSFLFRQLKHKLDFLTDQTDSAKHCLPLPYIRMGFFSLQKCV